MIILAEIIRRIKSDSKFLQVVTMIYELKPERLDSLREFLIAFRKDDNNEEN